MIDDLLSQLDHLLRERRPDYHAALQAPASEAEIDALRGLVDDEQPEALLQLYRWKNGQPRHNYESLHDNWMFMPIDDIVEAKNILDGMIGADFDDPEHWRREWLPFLSNGGGDHLCLDLASAEGERLLCFWHDWEERDTEFASLADWLQTVIDRQSADDASDD